VRKKEKKAANLQDKQGWWKQNYKAGFDAKEIVGKKITAGMLQDAMMSKKKSSAPPVSKPQVSSARVPPPPPPMKK